VLEREKWVKVGGWKGTTDTHELIISTNKAYKEKKAKENGKKKEA
jgi:inorganic pyrophosphatase